SRLRGRDRVKPRAAVTVPRHGSCRSAGRRWALVSARSLVLLSPHLEARPAAGPVRLGKAERRLLRCTSTVSGPRNQRELLCRFEREAPDPTHPGVTREGRLDEAGGLPRQSAVSAELDAADPASACIGDSRDVVLAGREVGTARGQVDAL